MVEILFRVDASPSLGGGHVMRCLTLADELRLLGTQCVFASTAQTVATVPALRQSGHRLVEIFKPLDADALHEAVPDGCDWLVVDHYGWDASLESRCRSWAENIFVIDDLANRPHDCDLLLDQTWGRTASAYEGLVPARSGLMVGSSYALLRPEFAAARPASLMRRTKSEPVLKRVLVSVGFTDPANVTETILKGIIESGLDLTVDVVLGPSAPKLASVRSIVDKYDAITLHVDTSAMAELMARADLCFGAAGSTTWERCCLGLPTVMTVIADNQSEICARLAEADAAISLGPASEVSSTAVADVLAGFHRDLDRLAALTGRSAGICDGRGAGRISIRLQPEWAAGGKAVWLRPAAEGNLEETYAWQSQPETRRFGRNSAVPSYEEHQRWFLARLKDPASLLNIIVCENENVGSVRLDMRDDLSCEISIVISAGHYGRGLGLAALRLSRRLVPEARIHAEILPGNVRSAALFDKAGYLPKGYGWRSIPPLRSTLS
jgi:UDP-2,4-diacetamido-2,4,6-trideoxy-beta-L-altropyranose hydrolase